jgi:hypothetical protein
MLCEKAGFNLCFCTAFSTKLGAGKQIITSFRIMSRKGLLRATFGTGFNMFCQGGLQSWNRMQPSFPARFCPATSCDPLLSFLNEPRFLPRSGGLGCGSFYG